MICPKTKSATHCFTELFWIYQNKYWTMGHGRSFRWPIVTPYYIEDCRISRIQITWWPFQGCHLQMTRSNGIAKIVKLKVFNTILLKKLFILPINNGITVLKIGILFWFLPFVIFRSLYMQNLYIFIEISSQCCSKNIDHEWGKSVVVAEFLILIVLNLKCEKKIIGTSNIFFLFSMYMGKKC